MLRTRIAGALLISLLVVASVVGAPRRQLQSPAPTPVVRLGALTRSAEDQDLAEGLKKLIEDMLSTVKSHDEARISALIASLQFSAPEPWFTSTFGPKEGPRLARRYTEILPEEPKQIREMLEYAIKVNKTEVEISILQNAPPADRLLRAVLEAVTQATPIFLAKSRGGEDESGYFLGGYVYEGGGFRFVTGRVWQALSTAPPPISRIRQGGNVQVSKLTSKVQPRYPEEARTQYIQGVVRLHVIVATDGTIQQIELMKGDPILAKAAIEAVRQWRYQPTTLNGTPVEVDTTIDVIFSLNY
jgi:TonB family protein